MNVAPIIEREMRGESRRPLNYWLRVLAGGVLILVFASVVIGAQIGLSGLGAALFGALERTLRWALWIIVPLMTADCVSREKREGTLGLLFLTPLTVVDVIAGKVVIHVLRAVTLFLAAVPLLGLPFVLGGVSLADVLVAVAQQANAVLLGIAAGIFASTRGGSEIQVMVKAEGCAFALLLVSSVWMGPLEGSFSSPTWLVTGVQFSLGLSLLLFFFTLNASARRLKENWQEESAGQEQPRWVEVFSKSESWREVFYWDKSRTLDHNPVAWLQEYSWTARLTKWGWFLLLLLAELITLNDFDPTGSASWQTVLTAGLALGVAFSAAGSFRREHNTGLLELLLVTPLSVRQIVGGRIWGICCHYLPAIGVVLVGVIGDRFLNPRAYSAGAFAAIFANPMEFVLAIVVGIYLSLGRLNFLLAWLLTWVTGFVLPTVVSVELGHVQGFRPAVVVGLISGLEGILALVIWFLLDRKIRRRTFAIVRSDRN